MARGLIVAANARRGRAMAGLRKRSVQLSGHATSIALEPEFWAAREAMASAQGVSLAVLVGRIDEARGERGLASACRVAALRSAHEAAPD